MKKTLFVLLAFLGMAAMEVKAQAPNAREGGCPSKSIGGFNVNQGILRIWCFYCEDIKTFDQNGNLVANHTCDRTEPRHYSQGLCLTCITVTPYNGPLGDPTRPRLTVTFVPTGTSWVVYGDTANSWGDVDATYWDLELIGG